MKTDLFHADIDSCPVTYEQIHVSICEKCPYCAAANDVDHLVLCYYISFTEKFYYYRAMQLSSEAEHV